MIEIYVILYLIYIKCRQKVEEYEMHQVLHVIKQSLPSLLSAFMEVKGTWDDEKTMLGNRWLQWMGYALHEDAKWTSRHMTLKAMKCSSPSISLFFVLLLQCSGTSTVKGFLYLNELVCVVSSWTWIVGHPCKTLILDSHRQSKMHVASVISYLQNKLVGGHYH